MKRRLAVFLALLFFVGCATPTALSSAGTDPHDSGEYARLTIVGTNDLHGWVAPKDVPVGPEGQPVAGGLDTFAGYLNILREKRPGEVVLLDGGDMFQGTLVANHTEGAVVIKAYNHLGYDAVAIGNHEFDYGPVGPSVVALTEGEDPLGNIKKRIEEARFPVLAGNIFDKTTGEPVNWKNAKRTHLLERNGVTIGVIGLTTPTTPSVTLRQNVETLEFKSLAPVAVELAEQLRARGADVVLLVVHAGTGCQHADDPSDASSCNPKSELWELLHELPSDTVDAVVAAHTHQYVAHFVNGVPSIQSGSFGAAFGVIELVYNRKKQQVERQLTKIWQPTPVCRFVFESTGDCSLKGSGPTRPAVFMGQQVTADDSLAALLAPDLKKVEAQKQEPLGPVLERPFGRERMKESELGNLVADIMRESVAGADVAFTNSGGLRADLPVGPLTYGDIFNALPFENRIAQLRVTGSQLREMMKLGVAGKHGIMQVSGMRMVVAEDDTRACDGSRLVDLTLDDGSPVDDEAVYLVLTNDFVATGGDGFTPVLEEIGSENIRIRNDLPPLREIVAAHLRGSPSLKGPEPRQTPRIGWGRAVCDAPAAVR